MPLGISLKISGIIILPLSAKGSEPQGVELGLQLAVYHARLYRPWLGEYHAFVVGNHTLYIL